MNKNYKKHRLWIVLLGTIFLCLFILGTNPTRLSLPLLLVPPAAVFIIIYQLTYSLLQSFTDLSKQKLKVVSASLASGPVIILLLASLGQLTPRDTVLSLLFLTGTSVYFSRVTTSS